MLDDTRQDSGPTRLGARLQSQFSLRAMLVLMTACAIWLWLLLDLDLRQNPFEFAVFALITLAVSVGGLSCTPMSSPGAERCWYPPSYCHYLFSAP